MASVAYDIGQGERKTISNPMRTAAVGGDNPTPFYLNFPYLPPGMQWVFPYTYNFMYPIESPTNLLVDASKIPTGFPPAPTSTSKALVHAYDTRQPYNAGVNQAATSPSTQAVARGTLTNVDDTVTIPCGGAAAIGIQLSADSNAGHTMQPGTVILVEGTIDDVLWNGIDFFQPTQTFWTLSIQGNNTYTPGTLFVAPCAGLSQLRLHLTTVGAGEGAMTWTLRATPSSIVGWPIGAEGRANSVPVTIASDQTTIPTTSVATVNNGWQSPANVEASAMATEATLTAGFVLKSAQFNVQFAANGTLDLVAAVAGQRVYCIELNIESNAAVVAAVTLQDDVPNILSLIRTDNIGFKGGRALHGVSGALGHKVQLKNGAAVLPTVAGELIYVQL